MTAFLCGKHRLNAKISRPKLRLQQSRPEETMQDLPSLKSAEFHDDDLSDPPWQTNVVHRLKIQFDSYQ